MDVSVILPPFAFMSFVPLCRILLRTPGSRRTLLRFRFAHNIISSILALALMWAAEKQLRARPSSIWGMLCAPAPAAPWFVRMCYASKFYEWLDTAFIIASERPISSLHYNHHLTTAMLVAAHVSGRERRSSVFDVSLLHNALVNVLMYSYYARPQPLLPFKRTITRMQVAQHVIALIGLGYTSIAYAHGVECDISPKANFLSALVYAMYLTQLRIHSLCVGRHIRMS